MDIRDGVNSKLPCPRRASIRDGIRQAVEVEHGNKYRASSARLKLCLLGVDLQAGSMKFGFGYRRRLGLVGFLRHKLTLFETGVLQPSKKLTTITEAA